MTDNSNLVLHWEIDNAEARFATRKVVSDVFEMGGFKWIAGLERRADLRSNNRFDFTLRCDSDRNENWKCDAEVEVHVLDRHLGIIPWVVQSRYCFDDKNHSWSYNTAAWSDFIGVFDDEDYSINDKVTLEFRIHVISSDSGEPIADVAMFAAPNNRSDVILRIGDEKLHVSKEYLAVHSPVFETLFFGDFAEKGKEEVEIKDVVYEEFLDLLHVIYVEDVDIRDDTVGHILKLADRFQMERVLKLAKKHLMMSKGFDVVQKFLLADQYRLSSLRDQCLNSFTTLAELTEKLKAWFHYKSPEYVNFSLGTKGAISDRVMKLSLQ